MNSMFIGCQVTPRQSPGLRPDRTKKTFFNYEGLPADNGQFGIKMIIASIPQYDIADTINVRIYYPKYATNNPGNNLDPNWYYYWKQTSANINSNIFGGDSCSESVNGYFKCTYSSADSFFHICPSAGDTHTINIGGIVITYDGIDNLGITMLHEYLHMETWFNWYGNALFTSNDDNDGDMIPNSIEIQMGTNPNNAFTYDSTYTITDWEHMAYIYSTQSWVIGHINSDDWANPGHQ